MSYTNGLDNPELYFQAKIYTGNGGTQSITLDGSENMQPDWVWIKRRNSAGGHMLTDVIRGVTKTIITNENSAEQTFSNGLTAFGSDGFTVGSEDGFNKASDTFVAWNWKAGTSFSNDASATGIGSIDSAGSVSTTAGFSIIRFSGTGSLGTVAHGLGAVPHAIFFKRLDANGAWASYHKPLGATVYMRLDSSSAKITASDEFNDTEPTSTVFTVDTDGGVNASGTDNMIAYCMTPIKGYSKFSSFVGNGNSDGTFIYTGFKPAFVLYKCSSDNFTNWQIHDSARSPSNLSVNRLNPNDSSVELSTTADSFDLLSNGFKARGTASNSNNSGSSFIYMAFAESPFVTSTGIPTTAR
jgi:hypothetical protein